MAALGAELRPRLMGETSDLEGQESALHVVKHIVKSHLHHKAKAHHKGWVPTAFQSVSISNDFLAPLIM